MTRPAPRASALLLLSAASCGASPSSPETAQPATSASAQAVDGPSAASKTQPTGLAGIAFPSSTPTSNMETEADGAPRRIAFPAGSPVVIEPVKVRGRRAGVVAECAVRIDGRVIATVGEQGSATEVLECHRLEDAGALPPEGDRRRLGLVYSAGSPNTGHRVATMLVEDEGGRWALDDAAFERFAEAGADRIDAMARALDVGR